jgi:cupin fold WbuC family metalloprotein
MEKAIKLISQVDLTTLVEEAKNSPRLRKNLNFHPSNEAQCHRLLNALEPGSYVQPHCHLDAEKDETLLVVSGRFGVLIFNKNGSVAEAIELSPQCENFGITIPTGVFHSMLALESGSVFFEAKAGPYVAIRAEERATWAPAEGDIACANYYEEMLANFRCP